MAEVEAGGSAIQDGLWLSELEALLLLHKTPAQKDTNTQMREGPL